jgi:hypothetical protein
MRAAILDGTFADYATAFLDQYQAVGAEERLTSIPLT